MTYEKGSLYTLPLSQIHTDPDQPRKFLDPQALEELAASIKEHGVLQPVLFRQDAAGAAILVAGERRFQAAQMAGLESIPAVFVAGNHSEIALVENLLRQDLTAVEEAEALDRIMKEHGYKQEDLSRVIGKSQSTLSEILSLNRLPQEVRDDCRSNPSASRRALAEIAKSKQQRAMLTLYKKYKEKALSSEKIKQKARRDRRTASQQTADLITTVQTKLETLNVDQCAAEDRESICRALEKLKGIIEQKLTALSPAEI